MTYDLLRKLAIGAALLALGACSGGGGDDDDDDGPQTIQERFGSTFANAFNADLNSEPIDPKPGDLPDISLTDDPIDF